MEKDIEGLAKIGEKVIMDELNTLLNYMSQTILIRDDTRVSNRWKDEVEATFESYKKERDRVVSLGLDISSYDNEFSELNIRYSKIIRVVA